MVDGAIFIPDGNKYVPTGLARGGWSDDAQHGGPPCGLLAHVIESVPTDHPMQTVRITVDLIRPVPMAPVTVATSIVRHGRRIQLVAATIEADGVEVALARALRIRIGEVALPEPPGTTWVAPLLPEELAVLDIPHWHEEEHPLTRYYVDAIEIRSVGDSFVQMGRGVSWIRLRYPVVAGTPNSPLVRVAAVADLGNGNSMALDPVHYLYVNPELTLHLHRLPTEDWVGMDSLALQHPTGIGLADTLLFDTTGPFGRVTQSQLIEKHDRPGA
ncbi:MAG: thioesterase family protein [Acidimicrobiia bacterium]